MSRIPSVPDEPDWFIRMRVEGRSMSMVIDDVLRRHGVDGAVKKLRKFGIMTAGDLLDIAIELDTELGL